MRKGLLRAVLMLAVAATVFAATKQHDFQPGKLLSIDADERMEDGTSERWAIFTVQIGDMLYTARGPRIRSIPATPDMGLSSAILSRPPLTAMT